MEGVLSKVKNIHLVGIGGAGMSGLALLLKDRGFSVKGSDIKNTYITERLQEEGVKVFIGHRKEQLASSTHLLSYSSAVDENNPEILEAKRRGIAILRRGELLSKLCQGRRTSDSA